MPNARHAPSVLIRTLRRLGQHGVCWHPYQPYSGAEALRVGISQTERAMSFRNAIYDGVLSAPTSRYPPILTIPQGAITMDSRYLGQGTRLAYGNDLGML